MRGFLRWGRARAVDSGAGGRWPRGPAGIGARRILRWLWPGTLLTGCAPATTRATFWMLDPKGVIAATQTHYLALDVLVMLFIIVPTGALIIGIMRRYRGGRGGAYDAHWDHSNAIEAVVWGIPIITVGILSYYSVKAIYAVDPNRPAVISRAAAAHPGRPPLDVDVISTDWQWVFLYPQQHIATVDRLVVPVGTPVRFRLTSATVVNDFYIPQLVGMIDVMPGMRVRQALIASRPGTYEGFSANYAGAGFSWMDFETRAVGRGVFRAWVKKVQGGSRRLTYAQFERVARPTIDVSAHVSYYAWVEPGLFRHVVTEVRDGKTYPTPMAMTENMTAYLQSRAAQASAH